MERNIMLAFVSTVSPYSLKSPITYRIHGAPYTAVQTNESAIVHVERGLGKDSLAQIFLIVTSAVKNGKIPKLEKPPPPAPAPVELSRFGKIKRWFAKTFGFSKPVEPPPVEVPPPDEEPALTHLEFLKTRLIKEFPHFDGRFSEIDYADAGDSLEENILQIADIADTITAYARNFPDCKIKVHADMTGGFRHTSMLMLSIIQLLSYRGIETGMILYSDPGKKIVYRANEIQRVSLLITGADEFVKFGSVNALQEYFAENPSAAASDLLKAMKNFSDAIKICRTGTIEGDLKKLGEEIQKFRATGSKDLKSRLFAKILDTVEAEYGNLIHGVATRFEIIRWCMRKELWQQAITLCIEWLPEEIVSRQIFMPGNSDVQDLAEANRDWRSWQQHFVISYTNTRLPEPVKDAPSPTDIRVFCTNIRAELELFTASSNYRVSSKNYCGELKEFLREFEDGYSDFIAVCNRKLKVIRFREKFPHFDRVLQALHEDRAKNPSYNKNFFEFMLSLSYDRIIHLLSKLPNEAFMAALGVDKAQIPREEVEPLPDDSDAPERKWFNRQKIYVDMLNNKVAQSKLDDRQLALEFLHDFYEIRRKRNEIDHANGSAEIAELQDMIENYLGKLEKI
ncbi:MAG: hypothetical protein J5809_05340 [Selenomonadaceae bacterium]|nr:hypothetical protein [Selenomonadaceae bacterium]